MSFHFTFLQNGLAPLNLAADHADNNNDTATVILLLDKGADVNVASKVCVIFRVVVK